MKRTSMSMSIELQAPEMGLQGRILNPQGVRITESRSGRGEKNASANVSGNKSLQPAVFEDPITTVNEGSGPGTLHAISEREGGKTSEHNCIGGDSVHEVFTHRPGKERMSTSTRSPVHEWPSQPLSDNSGSEPRVAKRTWQREFTDLEDSAGDRRCRGEGTSRKRGQHRSVEQAFSDELDQSLSREVQVSERQSRDLLHRTTTSRKTSRRRTARNDRGERGDSVEEESSQSPAYHGHRSRRSHVDNTVQDRRRGREMRELSEERDSLRSNAEEERYGLGGVVVRGSYGTTESPMTESQKRQERRRKQGERESGRRSREKQGLKGHYITVNHVGVPYGFGVGAWKQELNRLSSALDPSITNIRYQKEEDMAILRQRLKDSFQYSALVDRAHIRKLAGKFVTQRRSRLLTSMKEGDDYPSGLNEKIWRRLDHIRQDPHREELSQRMKYANATRLNPGRTGLKGEDGIREDLERVLGREPDPQEVENEMRRKKGYSGISKKRREGVRKERSPSSEMDEHGKKLVRSDAQDSGHVREGRLDNRLGSGHSDFTLIVQMQKELEELRAQIRAVQKPGTRIEMGDCGLSSSMRTCSPESNATSNQVVAENEGMQEDRVEEPRKRAAGRSRKLRGSPKA